MGMNIIEATKNNRLETVRQLLQDEQNVRFIVDDDGRNALHWATEFGYTQIAKVLVSSLDKGPLLSSSLLDVQDAKGQTALHIACNTKREDVACLLISLQSSLTVVDHVGNTPLHRAVRMNLETAACMMCELGAEVNAKNSMLWTPLHEAARLGNESIIRNLIAKGADLDAETDTKMSPFLTAFFYYKIASKSNGYPNLENVWRILIEAGCCLSKSDGHWSPLTAAIACDHSFIASLLLFNGCKLEKKDKMGRSLIQYVFICSDPMLIKLLVILGFIPTPEEIAYCSRQLPMYSKSFVRLPGLAAELHKDRHDVVRWLRERSYEPPTLQAFCRTSIRAAMNEGTGDRSIIQGLKLLPIPNGLKRYLALSDFAEYLASGQLYL